MNNDLIDKITAQAHEYADTYDEPYTSIWFQKYNECFAELIVKECTNKCKFVEGLVEVTNTDPKGIRKMKRVANSCARMINEQFGVE